MPADLTGWFVGYVIAAAVIIVVVGLIGWILSVARRIGVQANDIVAALGETRETTAPIPAVATLNTKLGSVVNQATTATAAGSDARCARTVPFFSACSGASSRLIARSLAAAIQLQPVS